MLGLGLNLIKSNFVPKIPIKLVDGSILPLLNQSISITRSGLAISPLQSYSYTSGTVVNNDTLVTLNQNNRLIPFIGGDTASLNFDFGLKVANSVAETPMKLYKSQIDVANPPIPTDASWVEVTDQKTLDKLKAQNEIPITSVDYANRTAVWNGKNLVNQSDSQPAVRDDFVSKTTNNTTVNPNIAKYCTNQTSLQIPSSSNFTETEDYTNITTQNGTCLSRTSSIAGQQLQQLYSFDIISELESKYGSLPCPNDLASKIAYAKANISKIVANWTGYGVGPLGNKANTCWFDSGAWGIVTPNTSSTPTLITNPSSLLSTKIQNDGFVHFLAYSDAARTTDSTLLVLTGHGLVAGDIISSVTRGSVLNYLGSSAIPTVNSIVTVATTGQIAGDTINKYKRYIVNTSAGSGTTTTNLVISSHGLSVGDAILNNSRGGNGSLVATVVDANTVTLTTAITGQTSGDLISLYHFTGTQTAESTVIPSTIYTDYISLDIQLKPTQGYDLLVPSNPRRDSVTGGNYDNIVMASKTGNNAIEYFTNNSVEITTQTTGKATGYLCELDLSPICTSLFGGSNAALKSALKTIQADVYASGYGASGNDVSNGVKLLIYGAVWDSSLGWNNTQNSIQKCTIPLNSQATSAWYVMTNNKLFLLVTSTNNSTVDIPASVSLDYLNIRVDLSRANDIITPMPITL